MNRSMWIFIFAALLLALPGCSRRERAENKAPKDNVLIDYVKTPLDKANAVKGRLAEHDRAVANAVREAEETPTQ